MGPKVSIIIPFYNCAFVDQAIESALNQTYENIEVVVVDDGSTSHTAKIESFKDKIVYIRKENGGTATAINTGLFVATGEYIAWLSSDDYFVPEKISKQLNFMTQKNIDASFTNFDYINKDNEVLIPWCCKRFSSLEEVYNAYLTYNAINGCTILIKRKSLMKLGFFLRIFAILRIMRCGFVCLLMAMKSIIMMKHLQNFVLMNIRAPADTKMR